MSEINYIDRLDNINKPTPHRPTRYDQKQPMGRSAVAIVLACIFSLIIFPIAFMMGIMAVVVLYPDIGLDEGGVIVGWGVFGFVHALLIAIIAGMFFNRMRNYATNIMGITFIVGYLLAIVLLSLAYKIGGAEAFL